jgi:outer membrane lipoprotein-sorting protein
VLALVANITVAQTADEIIENYFKATGGKDKWATLKSVKMTVKGNQGGTEYPIVALQAYPNKQKQTVSFQEKEIVVSAFDGKEGWAMNFMTQKPEKMEAEDSQNAAKDMDFPDPFLDYKAKGYAIALEGEETIEGTVCHKIKLTKKPVKIGGKEEEDFSYYFFDKENGVPIMTRTIGKKGAAKGVSSETFMSDYQDVNGLFFPFTVVTKNNGQTTFSVTVKKVEINVAIDDKEFAFPAN